MPFIFNPYLNHYPNWAEFSEFMARLTNAAVDWHKTVDPTGILSKTKVTLEGDFWNLQDFLSSSVAEFDTQININLDRFDLINQKFFKLSVNNQNRNLDLVFDLEIRTVKTPKAVRNLDEILEYLHKSFCFNSNSDAEPLLFSEQLTTDQGFSNKTYSSQLYGSNRLESVSLKTDEQFFKLELKFLFSINKK